MGTLTKKSSEKSNAPHMPGVPPLGLNIDRCIINDTGISSGRLGLWLEGAFIFASKAVFLSDFEGF